VNQLDELAQHRDALLLAEAIGWLHDYRKCSDEHLKVQASNPQGPALPRNELANCYSQLTGVNLQLSVGARTITNLLDDSTWTNDSLGQFLSRCHNTAHFDKQEPVGGKQAYPGMQLSSPFGFERAIPADLTKQMWALPWASLAPYSQTERQELLSGLGTLFTQVGADTRRSINKVDLWSWGLLVGALYKAALAGALLLEVISKTVSQQNSEARPMHKADVVLDLALGGRHDTAMAQQPAIQALDLPAPLGAPQQPTIVPLGLRAIASVRRNQINPPFVRRCIRRVRVVSPVTDQALGFIRHKTGCTHGLNRPGFMWRRTRYVNGDRKAGAVCTGYDLAPFAALDLADAVAPFLSGTNAQF
jgi:hypothetical protein